MSSRRPLISTVGIFVLGLILITALAGYFFIKTATAVAHAPGNLITNSAAAIANAFSQKVTVQNNSYTLKQAEIAEFGVLQRRIVVVTKLDRKFLNQQRTLIIKGVYTVKAGYRFQPNEALPFHQNGDKTTVSLPQATILSIETESQSIFHRDDAAANRFSSEDMETAFRENRAQVNAELMDTGFLEEVDATMAERLNNQLGGSAEEPRVLIAPRD